MSLSAALQQLPDDRPTRQAVSHVLRFFDEHPREMVASRRISSATGLDAFTLGVVLEALVRGVVIDCDAESKTYRYTPTVTSDVEVSRYLSSNERTDRRLQGSVDKFRERHLHRG